MSQAGSVVDVVVVGGGPSGLAAASALGNLDIVVLEAEDRLGGQLHSLARNDVWVNLGAHLLTGGQSAIKKLMADSGLDVIPIPGVKTALWFDKRLHVQGRVESYPFVLRLSWRERFDLMRFGLKLRLGVEWWRRQSRRLAGESSTMHADRLRRLWSGRTFSHIMKGIAPRVASIFETAARRSAGEASRITVGGAMALFGALWVSEGSTSVVNVAGGSGRFGEVWAQRLGDRAITGAKVTSVKELGQHVEVTYRTGEGVEKTLQARNVVVALPAPVAARVVVDLPDDVRDELASVAYGAFVSMGVLTKPLPPMPWDDIYAIATPDSAFDMLFHHTNPVMDRPGSDHGPRSLMCYVGGDRAEEFLDLDDSEIRRRFLSQLVEILPQTADAIDEAVVTKWAYGNCYPVNGASMAGTELWNQRENARVVLAGAYFAPLGGTLDAAVRSGLDSVKCLRGPVYNASPTRSGTGSSGRDKER
ncbi:flavin monoamine oxidase family protein [Paenarthrobacter nicotinovorans]|uniref:flavin monoamine oxidase family protein n=1 Tax=Paenarthrobacter nicotinovorans TaxID=29320 RepID=UPI003D668B92